MSSIAHARGAATSPTPARVTHLEEERARLRAGEEREAKGFVQVPRALLSCCKKLSAGEWAVLVELLDRGVSWGRFEPQQITQAEFRTSSGLTKQAIADGISSLMERGVLYAERTGVSRKSAVRYALLDPTYPDPGPNPTPEGSLVVHLLGGLAYSVNPVFLKSRHVPLIPTNQGNVILQSRLSMPIKQEKEILQSRKTKSAGAAPAAAPDLPQEISKNVLQERTEEASVVPGVSDSHQEPARMPASAPPGPGHEEVLETLHASAGWHADTGRDLLLLRHLQHYPLEWLVSRAADYALAEGTHSYQGFKNWCQSPRAQEKLRRWEQEQRVRAQRAASSEAVPLRSRKEQEEEEARLIAERNARSRARFGRPEPYGETGGHA